MKGERGMIEGRKGDGENNGRKRGCEGIGERERERQEENLKLAKKKQ